ncbi:MAG: DNA polymerase, partial [candidate division Zixibacteria bacterium]|nr:DNA polymerase [candidate division Zixibacteria bacterium]
MTNDTELLRWLFLDLNSYFASVEQQCNPELRGKPVAVVPLLAATSCCIATSREAKKLGVRTGPGVAEAKRICPGIQIVVSEPEK